MEADPTAGWQLMADTLAKDRAGNLESWFSWALQEYWTL